MSARPWHPLLISDRLGLWPIRIGDACQWLRVREQNRTMLQQWEPAWPANAASVSAFWRRCLHYHHEARQGRGYYLLIFCPQRHTLYGGVAICDIQRGAVQKATLGYWMAQDWQGRGLMQEALSRCAVFSFDVLRLHRLEAACVPHNIASRRVLERCGFVAEGFARAYIQINHQWQDHILFSLTDNSYPPAWARWPGGV